MVCLPKSGTLSTILSPFAAVKRIRKGGFTGLSTGSVPNVQKPSVVWANGVHCRHFGWYISTFVGGILYIFRRLT